MEVVIALGLGWMLDIIFGDPERLPHPIVYFGKWISFGEHRLNKGAHRKAKGAVFALVSIAMTFALTAAIVWYLPSLIAGISAEGAWISSVLRCAIMTIGVFFCLAGCTLRREVRMVFEAVDRGLDEGRRQVARIVGRDTSELDAQEIRTAALETLAENLSDGVIAPLFWFAVAGLPGMLTYKMINTLDSMIGYHSERYKDFGCWAAHIDDIANYIPARITALFMALVGGKNIFRMMKFVCKYGPQHASPNSGWPEAALAGILDCRFGGPHNYFGEYFYKPFIGTNPRQLTTEDMRKSLRVCFMAECVALAMALLVLYKI